MSDYSCGDACFHAGESGDGTFLDCGDDWQKKVFQYAAFDVAERSRRMEHVLDIGAPLCAPSGRITIPAGLRDPQRATLIR